MGTPKIYPVVLCKWFVFLQTIIRASGVTKKKSFANNFYDMVISPPILLHFCLYLPSPLSLYLSVVILLGGRFDQRTGAAAHFSAHVDGSHTSKIQHHFLKLSNFPPPRHFCNSTTFLYNLIKLWLILINDYTLIPGSY